MVRIVSGEHTHHVRNRFLAALLVHAVMLPTFAWKRLQHGQIVFAQHAEQFDRMLRIALTVLKRRCPYFLIVGLNRCPVCPDDLAQAPTANDFGVRQMRDDFCDRPLPRLRLPSQLLWGQSANQLL